MLELGKKLVEELGLEPSVDTLGRWMAHYVASLIDAVEASTGEERTVAERRCFETILNLWQHRSELPDGARPFANLDAIIRTVESLDPENSIPRYFRSARRAAEDENKDSQAEKWITIAEGLDYTAKVLIGESLALAAEEAVDKSAEWVELAEAAGLDRGVPEIVIRFVTSKDDLDEQPDEREKACKALKNRIDRLEGFMDLAAAFMESYRDRLKALTASDRENN